MRYISDDVDISVSGVEGIVPYVNKYVGKEQSKIFIEKIKPEIIFFEKEYIIADANKLTFFLFLTVSLLLY